MVKFVKSLGKATLLALVLIVGVGALYSGMIRGFPPQASAEVPDWDGHSEHFICGGVNGSQGTPALIDSAVTSTRLVVKCMTVSAETSGVYHLFSGSTMTGANEIAQFYFVANTPYTLTVSAFRGSVRTAAGSALYENGAGILHYTMVVQNSQN